MSRPIDTQSHPGLQRTALAAAAALALAAVAACGSPGSTIPASAPTGAATPAGAISSAAADASIAAGPSATTGPSAMASPAAAGSPGPPLLGPAPTGTLDSATAGKLQAVIDDAVSSGSPDAIAAVVTSAGTWSGAAGIDGPKRRAATPKDVASIASVSKLFVATLVMRLVEDGRMDLDTPLDRYLGQAGPDANGATVRQALAMRSGIGGTVGGTDSCDKAWTRADVIGTFPVPGASPGTTFDYSNPTYKLIGFAVEATTGRPLAEALDDIVARGGGGRILLQEPGRSAPKPWALPVDGYGGGRDVARFGEGGALPCMGDAQLSLGAAGMAADMPSLAAWGYELFAGRIVSPESIAEMLPGTAGYGLGMEPFPESLAVAGSPALGHTGSKDGYKVVLVCQPAKAAVVAVVVNSGSADDSAAGVVAIAARLLQALPDAPVSP
jgi:D-alanyl-D-alanine carboxypeptidase